MDGELDALANRMDDESASQEDSKPVDQVRTTLICGGLGGARLAPYLACRHQLTVICNVADDLEFMGLHVSPDLDAVLYALAGCFDHERGYGVRDDSGLLMTLARRAGIDTWFWIGDRDL